MIAPRHTMSLFRALILSACAAMIACGTTGSNGSAATPTSTTLSTSGHSVQLKWTASTSTDVIGYNVYRGTSASGPFGVIANTGTVTSYVDTVVQPGQTYYYAVTALNSSAESTPTSPVTAAIPNP